MKQLGSFVRSLMAGSSGIARAPISLGAIDLGDEERELTFHVEHYRADPDALSVEQTQVWGALCLYCLARCATVGRDCPLLRASFSSSQVRTIRRGVDFWRRKEMAGAREAEPLVDQLRVEDVPTTSPHPDDSRAEGAPVEVEWLPADGEQCRLRIRLNQEVESEPLVVRLLVSDPLDVTAELVGSGTNVVTKGQMGVLIDDEWQPLALRFPDAGGRIVRRIEIVDLRGGAGQSLDVPPECRPRSLPAPSSTAPTPAPDAEDPDWAGSVEGPQTRLLLLQLAKHGAVTEDEAIRILGSHRALRRFSLEFERHTTKLPFRVRIETTDAGKRFVREGDR